MTIKRGLDLPAPKDVDSAGDMRRVLARLSCAAMLALGAAPPAAAAGAPCDGPGCGARVSCDGPGCGGPTDCDGPGCGSRVACDGPGCGARVACDGPGCGARVVVAAAAGAVEWRRAKGGAWGPARQGRVLSAGGEIRAGRGASAVILFSDAGKLRLGAGTALLIEEASPAAIIVSLASGKLDAWVNKNPDRRFEVRHPAATVSVRGTVFSVSVLGPAKVEVELFSGNLALTGKDGAERATLAAGERATVDAAPSVPPAVSQLTSAPPPEPAIDPAVMKLVSPGASLAPCAGPGCGALKRPDPRGEVLFMDATLAKGDQALITPVEDAKGRGWLNQYFGIFFHAYLKDEGARDRYAVMQNVMGFLYKVDRRKGFKAVVEDYTDRWYVDRSVPYPVYDPDPKKPEERAMLISGDAPSVYADDTPGSRMEKVGLFRTAVVAKDKPEKPVFAVSWLLEQTIEVGADGKAAGSAVVTPIWFHSSAEMDSGAVRLIGENPGFKFRMNAKPEEILQKKGKAAGVSYSDEKKLEKTVKRLKEKLAKETAQEKHKP